MLHEACKRAFLTRLLYGRRIPRESSPEEIYQNKMLQGLLLRGEFQLKETTFS
jgi:hypothetical protein